MFIWSHYNLNKVNFMPKIDLKHTYFVQFCVLIKYVYYYYKCIIIKKKYIIIYIL